MFQRTSCSEAHADTVVPSVVWSLSCFPSQEQEAGDSPFPARVPLPPPCLIRQVSRPLGCASTIQPPPRIPVRWKLQEGQTTESCLPRVDATRGAEQDRDLISNKKPRGSPLNPQSRQEDPEGWTHSEVLRITRHQTCTRTWNCLLCWPSGNYL